MYIDIFLGIIFFASLYLLWKRIAQKIPALAMIPDQEVSVLLEQNTAKLHRFLLHIFHFRIFYRERHYQDKFWGFAAKFLFKIHILILRFDNGLMSLVKKMRMSNEDIDQRVIPQDYLKQLGAQSRLPEIKQNPMQEVRPRKRTRLIADSLGDSVIDEMIPRRPSTGNSVRSRVRSTVPRRATEEAVSFLPHVMEKPNEVRISNLANDAVRPRVRSVKAELRRESEQV